MCYQGIVSKFAQWGFGKKHNKQRADLHSPSWQNKPQDWLFGYTFCSTLRLVDKMIFLHTCAQHDGQCGYNVYVVEVIFFDISSHFDEIFAHICTNNVFSFSYKNVSHLHFVYP
ncbi:MAG: hypothetical protein CL920_36475 [Deltaproteobacteria bacterium]|nr:hypothetical protein [Deltaproteobacteria bacterium]